MARICSDLAAVIATSAADSVVPVTTTTAAAAAAANAAAAAAFTQAFSSGASTSTVHKPAAASTGIAGCVSGSGGGIDSSGGPLEVLQMLFATALVERQAGWVERGVAIFQALIERSVVPMSLVSGAPYVLLLLALWDWRGL